MKHLFIIKYPYDYVSLIDVLWSKAFSITLAHLTKIMCDQHHVTALFCNKVINVVSH